MSVKIEDDIREWNCFIEANPSEGAVITDRAATKIKEIDTYLTNWLSFSGVTFEVQGDTTGGAVLIIDDDRLRMRFMFEVSHDAKQTRFKMINEMGLLKGSIDEFI